MKKRRGVVREGCGIFLLFLFLAIGFASPAIADAAKASGHQVALICVGIMIVPIYVIIAVACFAVSKE